MSSSIDPSQFVGMFVSVIMGIVFHFLQEDNPKAMFLSLLLYPWRRLQKFNQWIAEWFTSHGFNTSAHRVLGIELFGLGFTLMQIGEWAAAVTCWVLLAFIGFAKALGWGRAGDVEASPAIMKFFAAAGTLALCVLLIAITTLRKPDTEPWSNLLKLRHKPVTGSAQTPAEPEQRLTLESLFKGDFPSLFKYSMVADPIVFEDGERVTVTSQEYGDFSAKSSFVGFYVPPTLKTFRVCVRLANSTQHFVNEINKRMSMQMFDTSGTKLKDLTFSGRVFIYHEEPLTLKQKSTLVDYYQSKNLAVEFRGLDYLQAVAIDRKLKTQQGK
jgi:hypothetical protein